MSEIQLHNEEDNRLSLLAKELLEKFAPDIIAKRDINFFDENWKSYKYDIPALGLALGISVSEVLNYGPLIRIAESLMNQTALEGHTTIQGLIMAFTLLASVFSLVKLSSDKISQLDEQIMIKDIETFLAVELHME